MRWTKIVRKHVIKAKLDEGSPISLHVLLVQGVIAAEVVYSYK